MPEYPHDKPDQAQKIEDALLDGETILAVYDGHGAGTGFVGITTKRVILQDNSFIGKRVALTSIPYSRIASVSMVSNRSAFGSWASTSQVAIAVMGGETHEAEFRGDGKAKHVHDVIAHYLLG